MIRFLLFFFLLFFSCIVGAQQPALMSLKGYGGNQGAQVHTHVTATADGGFIIALETASDVGTGNIDSLCDDERKRVIFLKYNADASVLEWTKCYGYGGDSLLLYIFPQNDGGFILGGSYDVDHGYGFLICKGNAAGSIVWSKCYSRGLNSIPSDMIATDDGGYIMIGLCVFSDTNFTVHNPSSWYSDIAVIKLDSLGNKVWSKAIGGSGEDEAHNVIQGPAGSIYIYIYIYIWLDFIPRFRLHGQPWEQGCLSCPT